MSDTVVERDDEAVALERMFDDGAPAPGMLPISRSRRPSPFQLAAELPAKERAAQRRAAALVFRLYCVACGRSSESTTAPVRVGRCHDCGGTMLVELAAA
jgi:hypothetical protein